MVDIHCHILPASDDGVKTPEEARTMAHIAAMSGVDTIIITPHCNLPEAALDNYISMDLFHRMSSFRDKISATGNPIRFYPGAEIFYTPEVPALLRKGLLPHLAGSRYVLVEFRFNAAPDDIRCGLETIREANCIPVLAHPERYSAVQAAPIMVDDWIEDGTVIQINKDSLLGDMGKKSRRAACWLLDNGLVHVIASDAHSATSRSPALASVYELVESAYNSAYADRLLEENPMKIINDQPILRS